MSNLFSTGRHNTETDRLHLLRMPYMTTVTNPSVCYTAATVGLCGGGCCSFYPILFLVRHF